MSDYRPPPGQTEDRTTLAWTRTSFAFLGNGALLMIKNLHGPVGPLQLLPAYLAAAVALGTYLIALRRQRTLQQRPLPADINPRRPVHVIGTAVLALIVVTTVAQLAA
ncbi:DUF202 domain-containing protein [Mycobacterium paraense]|uniref:DUF202 domain-containing protein n=1 Tax=Mycobacterium paraense TaxID=767916 RepID=UPI000A14BE4C|nr:DUF202 domain-containing protein [Mycobacterium paraense]MCV7443412.1 DUF202 domain-containing protein [Mycobacterium paraense]ORW40135.1 hypothetical protein AWB89_21635 [Mycobacterium paraense]